MIKTHEPLLTVDELRALGVEGSDEQLRARIDLATAFLHAYCNRGGLDKEGPCLDAARLVAAELSSRLVRNPEGLISESLGPYRYSRASPSGRGATVGLALSPGEEQLLRCCHDSAGWVLTFPPQIPKSLQPVFGAEWYGADLGDDP